MRLLALLLFFILLIPIYYFQNNRKRKLLRYVNDLIKKLKSKDCEKELKENYVNSINPLNIRLYGLDMEDDQLYDIESGSIEYYKRDLNYFNLEKFSHLLNNNDVRTVNSKGLFKIRGYYHLVFRLDPIACKNKLFIAELSRKNDLED